jgi:hypothetical protein
MRTSARIWGIFIVIIKRKKKSPAENWGMPAKKLGNASQNSLAIRENPRCCKQLVASLGICEICMIMK